MTEPLAAVAYLRVSTQGQAEDGNGLALQESACRAHAAAARLDLVGVITERGVSGDRAERPALAQALALIKSGDADAILVYRLDPTLLEETDPATHPVRTASLTATLAYLHLQPDATWLQARREEEGVRTAPRDADLPQNDVESVPPLISPVDKVAAMRRLKEFVAVLPAARVYPVHSVASVFQLMSPVLVDEPGYEAVRAALDDAVARLGGDNAAAAQARDRGMAFWRSGRPLEALKEFHRSKLRWLHGDTLEGGIIAVRNIARIYGKLGLALAAKQYSLAADTFAKSSSWPENQRQAAPALLEAAGIIYQMGDWLDFGSAAHAAILARNYFLDNPFDHDSHEDLENLELAMVTQSVSR